MPAHAQVAGHDFLSTKRILNFSSYAEPWEPRLLRCPGDMLNNRELSSFFNQERFSAGRCKTTRPKKDLFDKWILQRKNPKINAHPAKTGLIGYYSRQSALFHSLPRFRCKSLPLFYAESGGKGGLDDGRLPEA
jgi:hypothetical protein